MAYSKADINHSQFYRYETYGRAATKFKNEDKKTKKNGRTMYDIVGEADRIKGYTDHIDNPKDPIILYGVSFSDAAKSAEKWCSENKEIRHDKKKIKYINEDGTETERIEIVERKVALKKTAQCCIAGIISAPPDMTENEWENYKKDSVEFLKKKFGTRLKSVVEHIDENYYTENFKEVLHHHLHFFVIPEITDRIDDIHPGLKAKRAADTLWGNREATAKASKEEKSTSRRNGDQAYRNAMRIEQDEFYDSVSYKYNLNRKGKKKCKYYTREEFLQYNRERNEIARDKNQIKKEKQQQLEQEEKLNIRESELDIIVKRADEYVKQFDFDGESQILKDSQIGKLDSPSLLEKNFPLERKGPLTKETPYEYAHKMIRHIWKFAKKTITTFQLRYNSLRETLKSIYLENQKLKKVHEEIIKINKGFSFLSADDLETLARKMKKHKFQNVREAQEFQQQKGLSTLNDIPEDPHPKKNKSTRSYDGITR